MSRMFSFKSGNDSNDATKFNLYLRAYELRVVQRSLEKIAQKPTEEKEALLIEYADMVHQAFDEFIDDSNEILHEVSFDDESLELSATLVTSLQTVISLAQGILHTQKDRLVS